jgi:hypothetical protein
MSEYPFIRAVAESIAVADNQDIEDWPHYEELAIAAIKTIKEWFDKKGN